MALRILRRPDNLWAVWSTVVDDFIMDGVEEELVIDFFVEDAKRRAREMTLMVLEQLKAGGHPSGYTYEGTVAVYNSLHPDAPIGEVTYAPSEVSSEREGDRSAPPL